MAGGAARGQRPPSLRPGGQAGTCSRTGNLGSRPSLLFLPCASRWRRAGSQGSYRPSWRRRQTRILPLPGSVSAYTSAYWCGSRARAATPNRSYIPSAKRSLLAHRLAGFASARNLYRPAYDCLASAPRLVTIALPRKRPWILAARRRTVSLKGRPKNGSPANRARA